jgi:TonB family protein
MMMREAVAEVLVVLLAASIPSHAFAQAPEPPQKVKSVEPIYPERARLARIQGDVVIEATISSTGSVTAASVVRSIPALDRAALDAVRQWEYTPTIVGGVAVPVIMTVTVHFELTPDTPANTAERLPHAVDPSQLFSGPAVVVRAPNSPDWLLTESTAEGMTFSRRDESGGNTYIAMVRVFPLPVVTTDAQLLEAVKAVLESTPANRFRTVEQRFELTSERPYLCVRYRSSAVDSQSRTPDGIVSLALHIRALYCRHPTQPGLGFHIGYSQRGGPADPHLESQAASFIACVHPHYLQVGPSGPDEAQIRQLRLLAEGGERRAQFELGLAFAYGDGVPVDYAAAASWFRKAAEQGDGDAQNMLGAAYQDGIGVPQDAVEALKWRTIAAAVESCDVDGKFAAARDALSRNMTPAQRSQSQKRADDWMRQFAARKR